MAGSKRKVAILTNFTSHDPAYSLCAVALDQVKMLRRHDYDVTFVATEGFRPEPSPLDECTLKTVPRINRYNTLRFDQTFEADVERMQQAIREALIGIDVVITHDLIYQPASLVDNVAARAVAAERNDLWWLHWVHSATTPLILTQEHRYRNTIGRVFPHSYLVYPNAYEVRRLSINFGYPEHLIKWVNHPVDIAEFLGFHPLTRRLVDQINLLAADIIACYPIRLDRGKQVEYVIRLMAAFKKMGRAVRLIIFDFHSTGGDKVVYREELKRLAAQLGLSPSEVCFMSEQFEETRTSSPHQVVADVMKVADVYMHPSRSETFSLTCQEAALCRNLLVLNDDFPPLRSVYGWAIWRKFGSNVDVLSGLDGDTKTEYADIDGYFMEVALRCLHELETSLPLTQFRYIRKYRNLDAIFRNQLEPLLYVEQQAGF